LAADLLAATSELQVSREYIARLEPELHALREKEDEEMSRWEDANARVNLALSEANKVLERNTLQQTVTHCNTLQHTAPHCNTHCSPCCNAHSKTRALTLLFPTNKVSERNALQQAATHCNTLQHTATHCNTHCNTLQHVLQPALQQTATHTTTHTATHANLLCSFRGEYGVGSEHIHTKKNTKMRHAAE